MRSGLLTAHLRSLFKASALVAVAVVATACSNDASRLDEFLTASTQVTSNQQKIIRKSDPLKQAYPGDAAAAAPSAAVAARPLAPAVSRSGLPPVSRAETDEISETADLPKTAETAKTSYQPPVPKEQKATGTTSTSNSPAANQGRLVLSPRSEPQNPLGVQGADETTTGSVTPAKPAPVEAVETARKKEGWDHGKGARYTVKSGETLYNISRRFGVPVQAIMDANNIEDASSVTAGSQILIPSYTYSSTAPVSAPDSDPTTKASRASRGFQGEARGTVTKPTTRAERKPKEDQAIASASEADVQKKGGRGTYVVASGDSLYGVAKRHDVSAEALREANGMTGNDLRIGQKLVIPPAGSRKSSPTVAQDEPAVDDVTTGSIPDQEVKTSSARIKDAAATPAPTIEQKSSEQVASIAKASDSTFRWPVKGRVITKFGERTPTGTNDGIDISVPEGTPIQAAENGTVIYSGSELEDFGKLILVSHEGGWVSAYAHASAALVRRGDKVKRGQVIAKSGRTGNATAPKLHFELRKNSNPVNPMKHLSR